MFPSLQIGARGDNNLCLLQSHLTGERLLIVSISFADRSQMLVGVSWFSKPVEMGLERQEMKSYLVYNRSRLTLEPHKEKESLTFLRV